VTVRVIAALSGGVDSAVAAARALDAGHDVIGVHLALAQVPGAGAGSRGCCSPADARDARRVADVLDIPYYVWDVSEEFAAEVIDDFVAEYDQGHTPHPCLRCNESIKFSVVLDRARALGFDAVCTGHYARLVDGPQGRELHRAVDVLKDQSPVLSVLDADQLAGALFPLGESTKDEVRAEAALRGLRVADKPDSHDICFIPDGNTRRFLQQRLGERSGDLVDAVTGEVVGHHEGTYGFTIGQRRGLDLRVPTPAGDRRYVVDIDSASQRVYIGAHELLAVRRIDAERPRWCGPAPARELNGQIQFRAHAAPVDARVAVDGDQVSAHLAEPVHGVALGQALVMYVGTRVVGSATISGRAG
jgi:tRNA-specific 2-thiouridylase